MISGRRYRRMLQTPALLRPLAARPGPAAIGRDSRRPLGSIHETRDKKPGRRWRRRLSQKISLILTIHTKGMA